MVIPRAYITHISRLVKLKTPHETGNNKSAGWFDEKSYYIFFILSRCS